MAKFKLMARGGLVYGVWLSLIFFLLALLFFVIFSTGWWVWLVAAFASVFALVWYPYSYPKRTITLSRTEMRVYIGRSFQQIKRLPVQSITGCTVFATPLQRILGITTLFVFTPGAFVILVGLTTQNAEQMVAFIRKEAYR